MHPSNKILLGLSFLLLFSAPIVSYPLHEMRRTPQATSSAANPNDPVSQLLHIMPSANSCSTPAASAGPNECATAAQAIGPLISSFQRYKITSAGEQAAILGWIALESAEMKYNINHFPGNPGQGTRVMLMPPYISKYVASMPEMNSEAAQAGNDPVKMLQLVLDDGHSFGAGPWFVSSQCSAQVRSGLASGTEEGWNAWITTCVGTTVTDQRKGYWVKAKEALNVQ